MTGATTPSGRGPAPDGLASVSRPRLYSDLVTRQTGRAVRLGIERTIADHRGPLVTVLDFRDVSIIDFSCADEVAAKLAGSAVRGDGPGPERFFLFTGLEDHHRDPVESALGRRELVVAAEGIDGSAFVLGDLESRARVAWARVCRSGTLTAAALADDLETGVDEAASFLRFLHRRRLLVRASDAYVSLQRVVAVSRSPSGGG